MKKRFCKECKKEITDRGSHALYCAVCAEKRRKASVEAATERQRKARRAEKARIEAKAKETGLPARNFASLRTVAKEAEAAGMSYGRYVYMTERYKPL